MEEILELKELMLKQNYPAALNLIEEMEEMSREDKVNKIYSFIKILLMHLIKQEAEQRNTKSWRISIDNALDDIARTNKIRKARGYYLDEDDFRTAIQEAYPFALKNASLEAFGGIYEPEDLGEKVDAESIKAKAFQLIQETTH